MNKWERKLWFKKNKGKLIKRGTIALSVLLLVVGVIYITYSKFDSKAEWTLINGKVVNNSGDVNIVSYEYDGSKHDVPPAKDGTYEIDEVNCTNADGLWSNNDWTLLLSNITGKVKCSLTFSVANSQYEIVSGDLDTVGSIVKIADEEFYVIGQEDENHVKLLSKWNLNVGANPKGTATGLQDEDVRGYMNGDPGYGYVPFSSTAYWLDGSSLKQQYENNDGYAYIYDSNSNLYSYVENYVSYLNKQGAKVSGRLISSEELEDEFNCYQGEVCSDSNVDNACWAESNYANDAYESCMAPPAPEWLYQTTYWTGSIDGSTMYSKDYVGFINLTYDSNGLAKGKYNSSEYTGFIATDNLGIGVRPVIILKK